MKNMKEIKDIEIKRKYTRLTKMKFLCRRREGREIKEKRGGEGIRRARRGRGGRKCFL